MTKQKKKGLRSGQKKRVSLEGGRELELKAKVYLERLNDIAKSVVRNLLRPIGRKATLDSVLAKHDAQEEIIYRACRELIARKVDIVPAEVASFRYVQEANVDRVICIDQGVDMPGVVARMLMGNCFYADSVCSDLKRFEVPRGGSLQTPVLIFQHHSCYFYQVKEFVEGDAGYIVEGS